MKFTNRQRSRAVLATVATAAIAVSLTGCSGGTGGATKAANSYYSDISIAFVSGPLTDNFFPPLYNGAKQAAKDLGVKLTYIPIDEGDIEKSSVTTMQAAIARKPSAIVVGDFVPSAVDPLIKQAVAAGIPVYVNQSGQANWEAAGGFGFIGQDATKSGTAGGAALAKAGSKSILCVINVPGNPYLGTLCQGAAAGAKANGAQSTVLNLPTADSTDPTKVTADIGAFLKTHTDIDGIFTLNAAVGTYAISAAKSAAAGRTVHIGSLGLSKVGLGQVQDGSETFIISEQPYLDGYLGVLFATQYAKFGLSPVGQVFTGPLVIDKSNIASTLKIAAKYPGVLGSS